MKIPLLTNLQPPEFDIAQNTMTLIYGQTLTWVGLYYSPNMTWMFSVMLSLIFYVKIASLRVNCSVSTKPWRAGQSQTIFFILTFLSLMGTFVYFIYIIYQKESSNACGPFRDDIHPYDVIGENFTIYIFQPGVAGCVLAAIM